MVMSTLQMERGPVATIASRCLTETGGSFVSGFCIVRKLKWKQARAMSSCRYRTVWRSATTGWGTYATDEATGFRCSTKWGPFKKTYLFLMRKEAKTDQDPVTCRARGERLSGWASPLIA